MDKKIIVIGSGISGLATAAYLKKEGNEVIILEKNRFLGGRASFLKKKGFVFDKGPSWYMMPEVFENFFKDFSKKTTDYYQLVRLPVNYRVFFPDGDVIDITENKNVNFKAFKKKEKDGDKKLKKFLKESEFLYELSMKKLVYFDYDDGFWELLKFDIIKNFFKLGLFTTLNSKLKKSFSSQKLQQILSFTSVFLGGSPYNTPAFYSLVAHADFNLGIYYPMGGINKVIDALVNLNQQLGTSIKLDTTIVRAKVNEKCIISLIDNKGKEYKGDIFVCASDMNYFQEKVVPRNYQSITPHKWRKMVSSPSAFLIYLGLSKKLRNVSHHNLYFSPNWKKGFDEVFEIGNYPENPSYYFHVPSVTDKSIAPKGKEVVAILVPIAPNLKDNDKIKEKFYEKIINHFEGLVGEKIKDKIEFRKFFSVNEFKKEYLSFKGSAFGLAHTLSQTAIFRPPNKDRKINNLYYTGQFTNPGVGMPPALISAKIVLELVKKYHG